VSHPEAARAADQPSKPTIVLVHGAFAGSSSWNGVIAGLNRDGYRAIAAAERAAARAPGWRLRRAPKPGEGK
jgi:alpha-beta hydrolase superfamily lysophospholipase